ncbi:MAG: flagellar basal body P-ring protein FlgI [Phycisphaerales bacterium]
MRPVLLIPVLLAACSNIERADPALRPGSGSVSGVTQMDVDPIMRGTVASEAVLLGFQDVVVRGYGLVVGLQGTGSRTMPAEVRAMLLRELARREVADSTRGMGISPERFLDSDDIAAVLVEGVIPAGATSGSNFDVRVSAVPGSSTTSLEGGRLWTCDLRPGPATAGSKQAAILAEARGAIVINPFLPVGVSGGETVDRMSGRVLNGGRVIKDMPLRLRLATPSHVRSATIAMAINSRFPREVGQRDDTARGKNGEYVDITVPPSFHGKSSDFAQLVRHATLDLQNGEAVAAAVRRSLLATPGAAAAASWRWQAIGKRSVPMIQDLYTYPEEQPRMAALEAGAKLDDPLAVPPLLDMARNGSPDLRLAAIRLLGRMDTNPNIDVGLRPLLDDADLDVRLTAYESLRKRRDPIVLRARGGDRFELNVVPSTSPLVYITQTGEPRIAVFGDALQLKRPLSRSLWGGRMILKGEPEASEVLVFFRAKPEERARVEKAPVDVPAFIQFLAQPSTPNVGMPGLDLRYGETIAALYELSRSGDLGADLRAEQDRILAEIMRQDEAAEPTERPEFPEASAPASVPSLAPTAPPAATPLDGSRRTSDTVPR